MKKAMVYIQSGGPTSVINSSLYGAIMEARKHPDAIDGIYGSIHGVEGLLNDDLIDLNKEDQEVIELLKQTPGAALGSTRTKLPKDFHSDEYMRILETLKKHNIGYVFINGGNDSMDTAHKLSLLCKEVDYDCKVMGVPKTVDNDLALTDHSLGFGSAARHIMNMVQSIIIDARSYRKSKIMVVEAMGRTVGWLAAAVALLPDHLKPDLLYLPEAEFTTEQFLKDIEAEYQVNNNVVAIVSEGLVFERDLSKAFVDSFNHVELSGVAYELGNLIREKLGYPVRSIELSLPQRSDPILTSKTDQEEAIMCGKLAVQYAVKGITGHMVCIRRVSNNPYTVEYFPGDVSEIANAVQDIPKTMFGKEGQLMDPSFTEYCLPLVLGSIDIEYKDGVYKAAVFKRHKVK